MGVKKHIPNTITSMNLLSGAMGVICTFQGEMGLAFGLMLLAAVFDFFDGLAARLLKAYSPIGKELDSLADMVSFGLLPSLMLVCTMRSHGASLPLSCLPLFLAVMSALRLAKFNVDERQSTDFIGLPTPSSAMVCGSLCCYIQACTDSRLQGATGSAWFLPLLALLLGLLLVSEIPMFGMKLGKGHKVLDATRMVFLAFAAVAGILVAVLGLHASLAVLAVFVFYILENLVVSALPSRK